MWRSATDSFNEIGWRFLNFIRIIEIITDKQRGGAKKAGKMYDALPDCAKTIVDKRDFIDIIMRWGNPVAHGHMPNAVIPKIPHGGYYQSNPDIGVLFNLTKILIREKLKSI